MEIQFTLNPFCLSVIEISPFAIFVRHEIDCHGFDRHLKKEATEQTNVLFMIGKKIMSINKMANYKEQKVNCFS